MKKFIKILRREYLQKLIDRLISKPGLRGRIDAKCVDCIYDDLQPGTWRQQVDKCTSPLCPLFDVRAKTTNK
tara:strand:+ start:6910 stop:7125 length:216 start_codon:yes stop_codon:yes gene_type:complete